MLCRPTFMAAAHCDAISTLIVDVVKYQPFLAIAGDGEVGKTTVLNAALECLTHQQRRKPVQITRVDDLRSTSLSASEIIGRVIGRQITTPTDEDLEHLSRLLMKGRNDGTQHLLVVDGTQLVKPAAAQFLRLVSDARTDGVPFMQVIFAGRHEFWKTLANDDYCPLLNLATARSVVEPLAEDEVRKYIQYRLKRASSSIEQVITDAALSDIIRYGQARPGRINRILDLAFTVGAGQGRNRVTPQVVDKAVTSLQGENLLPPLPVLARSPASAWETLRAGRVEADELSHSAWPGLCDAPKIAPHAVARSSIWLRSGALGMVVLGVGLTVNPSHPTSEFEKTLTAFPASLVLTMPAPADAAVIANAIDSPGTEEIPRESASTETASLVVSRASDKQPTGDSAVDSDALDSVPTIRPSPPELTAVSTDRSILPSSDAESAQSEMAASTPRLSSASTSPGFDAPQNIQSRTEEEPNAALTPASPQPEPTRTADRPAVIPGSISAPMVLPSSTLAMLLQRGAAMLAAGDILAARLLFTRAAMAGSAKAAEEVGKTYDPKFLADEGAIGTQADPTIAAIWYQRARLLGSAKAAAPLEQADVVIRE
jgi:type II secretory pathway predicted ATPase ExeA